MTARIIPFARPVAPVAAPQTEVPPPLLTGLRRWIDGDLCGCEFLGTRQSLIEYGVATEIEFPEGRKRSKYNEIGRPDVSRAGWHAQNDLFKASFLLSGNAEPEHVLNVKRLAAEVQAYSSSCENEAAKRLSALWDLRMALFVRGNPGYEREHLTAFDELTASFTRVVAAVLFQARSGAADKAVKPV